MGAYPEYCITLIFETGAVLVTIWRGFASANAPFCQVLPATCRNPTLANLNLLQKQQVESANSK